jgi:hypothetical protein
MSDSNSTPPTPHTGKGDSPIFAETKIGTVPAVPKPPLRSRIWNVVQLPLAVLIAVAAVAYLLWPERPVEEGGTTATEDAEIVKLVGQHRLTIVPGTPLEQKLKVADVNRQKTSAPLLKVTGSVVARLAPATLPSLSLPKGEGRFIEGRWDFNSPDLASAYADWLKARNDAPFQEAQRVNIFKLAEANLAAKKEVADRLEKLVKAGTDPVKDLVAAKADLLQTQIQGEKDKHEAQTNVDNARRTLATLERQLFQAGIDPALLLQDTASKAIVVAEVPEARVSLARQGDPCTAEFYGFPETKFDGIVGSVSPSISKDRRTLRVFFQVSDPKGILKPGMYADVGLCASPRETLLIPAEGVLHVGQFDYVLVADGKDRDGKDRWKVTQVKTGEQVGNSLEILSGLHSGDRVIGAGAILLKPYVVTDVQAANDAELTPKKEAKNSPPPTGEEPGVRAVGINPLRDNAVPTRSVSEVKSNLNESSLTLRVGMGDDSPSAQNVPAPHPTVSGSAAP